MTPAFWDASGVLPLCVEQESTPFTRQLLERHTLVVWWGTVVEVQSAIQRLLRTHEITSSRYAAATTRLNSLQAAWLEMQSSVALQESARDLLALYPLKAGDALQLAAALAWAAGEPQRHTFISGDAQLLRAAHQSGFQTIRT